MKPLRDAIRPTTFIVSEKLRDHLGLDITVVSETFQHTGSFKFRAAYNVVLNVPNDTLLTASSGNFGQALAYACKLLAKKCTVVMPATSSQVKIDDVRRYGASVELIDTAKIGRNERVQELLNEMTDAYVASPYDDRLVIDGNATLGHEIAGSNFDVVIVPVGGGGLISGIVEGLKGQRSMTTVIGAEPLLGNDAARSLKAGELLKNESEPTTIADGARTLCVGNLNWQIIREHIKEIIEVTDTEIAAALRLYFYTANLKCEPTGALALGALLQQTARFTGKKVCVVASGGNVDASVYSKLLAADAKGTV